jgi:predicted transcriptional regulator of viral defense system
MRFESVLDTLLKSNKRVFTTHDVAKLMGKPPAYASLMLSKSKRAIRIERGKYYLEEANTYEIASNIVFPSYVSLQAGLQYYGLIDQNIVRYSVIALKRHRTVGIRGNDIEFIKAERKLFFGYLNKGNVYVASPEKLFVDCLYFGRVQFSTLKDAMEVAKSEQIIDTEVLQRYAITTGSKVLASKLGFLLESAGINAERLLPYRYYNYVSISNIGSKGKNKRWMINYD